MENRSTHIIHADRLLRYLQQQNRSLSAYDLLEGVPADGVTSSTALCQAPKKLHNTDQVRAIKAHSARTSYCSEYDHDIPVFAIRDDCRTVTKHIDANFDRIIAGPSERTGFEPKHSALKSSADAATATPACQPTKRN